MQPFDHVSINPLANIYFNGRVISHTLILPDQSKKTIGTIQPGSYHFGTKAAERMEITSGECIVTIDGAPTPATYTPGTHFDVPADSGFTIEVNHEICQYICSFIPE